MKTWKFGKNLLYSLPSRNNPPAPAATHHATAETRIPERRSAPPDLITLCQAIPPEPWNPQASH